MSHEQVLLRAMAASPNDPAARLIYADWLEEHADPRGELLRSNWDSPRLSFVDWVASSGNLDYYLNYFPELRSQLSELEANRWWRDKLQALAAEVSPAWLSVVDTLGRPFHPFYFWNNTGPQSFQPGELPFREPIGTRGSLVTFESAFRGEQTWQPGLAEDLVFLCQLPLDTCEYGAASCPVHPFLCHWEVGDGPLTGAAVLQALQVADFRSQHIPSLDLTEIPYPGYHPGTDNDEIHNDPQAQHIFPRPDDVPSMGDDEDSVRSRARHGDHDALRRAVADGRMWYVLLHARDRLTRPGMDRGAWVVLFAVGRSLRGDRLLGVVSHQLCHNLCD